MVDHYLPTVQYYACKIKQDSRQTAKRNNKYSHALINEWPLHHDDNITLSWL